VQNVRAFGSETEVDQLGQLYARKLAVVRGSMDLTHEYLRVGALKGVVLDADGTTELLDIYQSFGMLQQTQYWDIASAANGDPKASCIALKRMIQKSLGGRSFRRVRVICSSGFFSKLTSNAKMEKAWELWNQGVYLRSDQSDADFEFADVVFEVYDGGTSAGDFIEDGYAYAYPEGVPGMFQSAFAPGDYMETVNTEGLPYYAKQELMPMGKGVMGEAQSNPLHFNSLPECVIRLSVAKS
jgi:hypothetical protein